MTDVTLSSLQLASPFTARGFVRFINVRPDKKAGDWICDECLQRVTPAKQQAHARRYH